MKHIIVFRLSCYLFSVFQGHFHIKQQISLPFIFSKRKKVSSFGWKWSLPIKPTIGSYTPPQPLGLINLKLLTW